MCGMCVIARLSNRSSREFTYDSVTVHIIILFFSLGTDFQRAISDTECAGGSEVKRLVFCSGKVYYELAKERQDRGLTNQVALVRIEQVCTHPHCHLFRDYCT